MPPRTSLQVILFDCPDCCGDRMLLGITTSLCWRQPCFLIIHVPPNNRRHQWHGRHLCWSATGHAACSAAAKGLPARHVSSSATCRRCQGACARPVQGAQLSLVHRSLAGVLFDSIWSLCFEHQSQACPAAAAWPLWGSTWMLLAAYIVEVPCQPCLRMTLPCSKHASLCCRCSMCAERRDISVTGCSSTHVDRQ